MNLSRICFSSLRLRQIQPRRTLFTHEAIGLTEFKKEQEKAISKTPQPDEFRKDIQEYLFDGWRKLYNVQSEKLQTLVYISKRNANDIELIQLMLRELKEFKNFDNTARTAMAHLILMGLYDQRSLYRLDWLLEDPVLRELFNTFSCTLLYMDLLYKSRDYEQIIELDEINRNTIWAKPTNYTKFIDTIVFGACYKVNTSASYAHATNLWNLTSAKSVPFIKSTAFYAAHALKERDWTVGFNVTSKSKKNFVIEQIKLLTYVESGNVDGILNFLPQWEHGQPFGKYCISRETYEKIQQMPMPTQDCHEKIHSILERLKESDRITDKRIDDYLDAKISCFPKKVIEISQNP